MIMIMMMIWVLALSRLVGRCQHFKETCCLHLQGAKTKKNNIIICFLSLKLIVASSILSLHDMKIQSFFYIFFMYKNVPGHGLTLIH
jgi:hypothetical protein